jgi:tripartite-type tricarboxylate transporter receptor subunit TctC
MMLDRRAVLAGAAAAAVAPAAQAQGFPSRPIRLVVTYTPGGGVDGQARLFARLLSAPLGGASLIVENRPGGATRVGTTEVQRAAPDGHTLVVMPPLAWIGYFYSGTYDTKVWEQMTPIGQYAETPYNCYQTRAGTGLDSWEKVVAFARARPDGLAVSGPGSGGLVEYAVRQTFEKAGIRGVYVPFQGSSPAHAALLAGTVQMQVLPLGDGVVQMRAAATHVIAASGAQRFPTAPTVPTFVELGIGDALVNTFSLWGPPGMPAEIVARIAAALREAIAQPEFIEFMEVRQAFQVGFRDAATLRADMAAFDALWGPRLAAAFRQ